MKKERLTTFTDAVLAIIITVLVFELEKPSEPTWEAILSVRQCLIAYALSFFWLGTMWINLHDEWHDIKLINKKVMWWNIVLLFFSSFFPYVTSFVSKNFFSSVAQGLYGIVVLAVTISNARINDALEKANPEIINTNKKVLTRKNKWHLNIFVKIIGLIITLMVYPPAMMISVLITMVFISIPTELKFWDKMISSLKIK